MSATVLCLAFSLAAMSQAPSAGNSVTPAERQKAFVQEINRRNAPSEAKAKAPNEAARQKARDRARRGAARGWQREEFEKNTKLQAQAAEEYRRMLPYLLVSQRQQLERMSAYERNQALNRIAAANEASARAINNAAAAVAANNNGFRTLSPNATPYGPFGIGVMPSVQGSPNFTINAADRYVPVGPVSFP
jgi:Calicivirus putative RNA polymerase/capsid protein